MTGVLTRNYFKRFKELVDRLKSSKTFDADEEDFITVITKDFKSEKTTNLRREQILDELENLTTDKFENEMDIIEQKVLDKEREDMLKADKKQREEAFELQEQENRMDVQSEKEMEKEMKANFEAQQRVREEDEERRIKPTDETEQEYLQKILYFYYSLSSKQG